MGKVSKPVRKVARTGHDFLARPTSKSVPGASTYNRKAATKSQATKSTYGRKVAGITPSSHDIHRTAGDAFQPHNKGNSKLSRKMKGVD